MARYIDFDAARAERQREPVVVRFFGRDWELHTGLPASIMLDVIGAKASGEEDISDEQAIGMVRKMVPEAVLQEWFDLGITIDELLELTPLLMRAYSGGRDEAPGEAPAPSAASTSSSASVGGSSKPTSSESTESTSTKGSAAV